MSCVAPGCKSFYGKVYVSGLSKHRIPRDSERREQWLKAIPRQNWNPAPNAIICGLHFLESDFCNDPPSKSHPKRGPLKIKKLKKDAVPSVFAGVRKMALESSGKLSGKSNKRGVKAVPATPGRRIDRKQVREDALDPKPYLPWALDFNSLNEDHHFWQWEEKWKEYYPFTGLEFKGTNEKLKMLKKFLKDSAKKVVDEAYSKLFQESDMDLILRSLRLAAAKYPPMVTSRFNFNVRQQGENEVFDLFLVELQSMVKSCGFCSHCSDLALRDRLVAGARDPDLVDKLLRTPDLSLEKTIQLCREDEKEKFELANPNEEGITLNNLDQDFWNDEPVRTRVLPRHKPKTEVQSLSNYETHKDELLSNIEEKSSIQNLMSLNTLDGNEVPENLATENEVQIVISKDPLIELVEIKGNDEQCIKLDLSDFTNSDPVDDHDSFEVSNIKTTIETLPQDSELHKKKYALKRKPKQSFEDYLSDLGISIGQRKQPTLCHLCPKEYSSIGQLNRHIEKAHENPIPVKPKNIFKCQLCEREFYFVKDLTKHQTDDHPEFRPHACNQCPSRFNQTSHLTRHIQVVHNKEFRFPCDSCDKRFSESGHLRDHVRGVHEKQFNCNICSFVTETKKQLGVHKLEFHPETRPHGCDVCGKKFSNTSILNGHIRRAHGVVEMERPHQCSYCPTKFKHLAHLQRHMKWMKNRGCPDHLQGEEGDSSKTFSKISSIWPPKCKLCDKTFTAVNSLRYHLISAHTKERSFKCNQCDSTFANQKNLDLHVKVVHLKERDHQCPQCESRFAQRNHLKHHIKVIHERVKDMECDLCDKKYASKPDLVNHLRKIHGVDVSYGCPHCSSKFLKKRELMDHLETVHVEDFEAVVDNDDNQ